MIPDRPINDLRDQPPRALPVHVAPHPRLVPHDIHFVDLGASSADAVVACERRGCSMLVDACRLCPRFARIDVHEAGYVMLCRSTDEAL